MRSAFEALWLCAAETMDVAALRAMHANLEARFEISRMSSERAAIDAAITELNGLIVSRLTQGLRGGPEARP